MFLIPFLILIMLLILDEWMKEKSEKILKLCIVNIVSTQGVQAKHTHVNQFYTGNGNNNFEAKYHILTSHKLRISECKCVSVTVLTMCTQQIKTFNLAFNFAAQNFCKVN